MSILQDRKGNMWFSTWDGINKFDGYTFRTYKAKLDNQIDLTNNRIDQMFEDEYGFLWMQTYDNHVLSLIHIYIKICHDKSIYLS